MRAYHFSDSSFARFDPSYLGSSTISRNSDDEYTLAVSEIGFCFIESEDVESLTGYYGEDFGVHLAECELNISENLDDTWENFCDWILRDGAASVTETLHNDGVEFLRLWNGCFNEIVVLDSSKIEILKWVK